MGAWMMRLFIRATREFAWSIRRVCSAGLEVELAGFWRLLLDGEGIGRTQLGREDILVWKDVPSLGVMVGRRARYHTSWDSHGC